MDEYEAYLKEAETRSCLGLSLGASQNPGVLAGDVGGAIAGSGLWPAQQQRLLQQAMQAAQSSKQHEAQRAQQQALARVRYQTERLTSLAYTLSLSAAVDLWFARYGDAWVTEETLESETQDGLRWDWLAARLSNASKLEVIDELRAYRLIE